MHDAYDAIIVGGGPSGATSAVLLAKAGWRVAVVEKASFPRRKVCGEFISETTWPLLRQLGVAGPLLKIAGPRVRRIGIYAGEAMVTAELGSTTGRAQNGGRAVGREQLDTLLLQRAAGRSTHRCMSYMRHTHSGRRSEFACTRSVAVRQVGQRELVLHHGCLVVCVR